MAEEYILEMNHIVKAFSGVKALDDVNFKVKRGEIMAICGENGAGKSTLMNVLSGVYPYGTYEGTSSTAARPASSTSSRRANTRASSSSTRSWR